MTIETDGTVRWRVHVRSRPEHVFELLASDAGRARFWAESTVERDGVIRFEFPDGTSWEGRVLRRESPTTFSLVYYGGSETTFTLHPAGDGTDLELVDRGVRAGDRAEVNAGWVSVLLALKVAADDGIDLRNHDPARTWRDGYADN